MPMKIVVVDDNKTNLMIVEKILRKAGYNNLLMLPSAGELYQYLQFDAPKPVRSTCGLNLNGYDDAGN